LEGSDSTPLEGWVGVVQNEPIKDCKCKKKNLYGRVKIVERHEDLRVKIVDRHEDLRVRIVEMFPDKCGKWQFVENFEDLKIKIVDSHEDISVRYVDYDAY
jgi:hypothetical protein